MRHSVVLVALLTASAAERAVEFNRDVRPILSDKCFLCHGPDARTKNVPLRLDVESEAKARVIVPGNPDASELVRRITADQAARRMPPVHSGLTLSEAEIAALRAWIAQGAQWQKHWSFLPPQRPRLPAVRNTAWPRNPIDHFVLARLESEALQPSAEAGRETLLRRASLDLTGLPPTPAEIAAFLHERSADAYEKAVDRLLQSPRYGERMAFRWLDAARYADTNGYQFDGERFMWRWRDWVIDAFNRNLPFDRFVVEQIAGDRLPNATMEQRLATGFNRNHRGNTEDGIVAEEYAVEYVVDRVETTSTVFLGLTLGCARCHNHKYDPFTQREFYQLFAYFNTIPEYGRAMKYGNSPPVMPAPTAEQQRRLAALNQRAGELERQINRAKPPDAEWKRPAHWWPLSGLDAFFTFEHVEQASPGRFGQAAVFDGSRSLEFPGVAQYDIDDAFTISAWIYSDAPPDGAIYSRMTDAERGKGFGLYASQGTLHAHITSNYADDAIRAETEEKLAPGHWYHVALSYDGSVQAEGVTVYVNGKPARTKVLINTLYRPFRNAGRKFTEPFRIGAGGGPANRFRGRIDQVLVYSRLMPAAEMAMLAIAGPLATLSGQTAAETELLRQAFLSGAAPAPLQRAWTELQALYREREKLERSFPTAMVMAEAPAPKKTHLLIRGAYDRKGEAVEPGVPAVLPPLPPGVPNNRLGFARWLTGPDHPLLARVTVNRLWQSCFGTGLVKTTEDFGQQGEWPSHPELLDWLATEFIHSGWDVKALLRHMVTSATYRQSSRATPELLHRDPDNRLLARGPRFRLAAETIRDQALYAAGLLTERLGGPSVKPYQPAGLWNELAMQDMFYVQNQGPDLYRRSLYTFWKRTIAPPMMVNFDSANREACVVRETRTNTPLQALNLMNDVTFLEAARFVAQKMIQEGGASPADRLRHGFLRVVGRAPAGGELAILGENLHYHRDYFAGRAKAEQFLKQGDTPAPPGLDPRELAAYTSVASLLLNLDEVVTKE